jgi:hypothetical protein
MLQARERFNDKHYQQTGDCTQITTPAECNRNYATEIELGSITEAPTFKRQRERKQIQNEFLEISLLPGFVPFAQADFISDTFTIPEAVWLRLRPGHYFARHRSELSGVVKQWHWNKV